MYPAGSQPFREIIESPEEAGPSLPRWRRISIPSLASLIFDPSSLSSSSTSRRVPHWYVHLGNTCIKSSVRDINELRNKEEWMLSILHMNLTIMTNTITLSSIWQPKWTIWGLVIKLDASHSHTSGRHWRRYVGSTWHIGDEDGGPRMGWGLLRNLARMLSFFRAFSNGHYLCIRGYYNVTSHWMTLWNQSILPQDE